MTLPPIDLATLIATIRQYRKDFAHVDRTDGTGRYIEQHARNYDEIFRQLLAEIDGAPELPDPLGEHEPG